MKAKPLFITVFAAALGLTLSSCSQDYYTSTDGYDTAEPIADGEIPPWIAENSDPAYESGSYTPAKEESYAYNPPSKPKVSKSTAKKTSTKKYTSKKKPVKKTSYRTYKVKKGDTLGAIARRYGTTVRAIKSANGLRSDLIHINQKLRIPRKK